MISQKMIARELHSIADRIDKGTCGVDDEEMVAIMSAMTNRKLNIEQICQQYGISRPTLNRWQQKGKLPPFKKDSGGKDYLLQSDIDQSLKKWNKEHPSKSR